MPSKSNELKVGVLMFAGIVVLVIFIMAIAGDKFWHPKKEYYVLMKFAGGVEPGVAVRYGGFKVGEVKEININKEDNSKIKAVLSIRNNTPVKYDSEAFINSIGIMGEYYIEITTGSNSSKYLPPENIITFREIPTMSDLYEDLRIIQKETQVLLENLDNVVREMNLEKVSVILSGIEKNMNVFSNDINSTIQNMSIASSKLGDLIENIDGNINKNSEQFLSVAKNLSDVVDKSTVLIENMTKTLNTLDKNVLISGKSVGETMNNLNDFSRNMKEFSNRIRSRPWTIFRKSYDEEKKKN